MAESTAVETDLKSETESTSLQYNVGEDVLCFDPGADRTQLLYHAKILEKIVKADEDGNKAEYYRVHFHGWNSTWDRDVSADFILKDSPENIQLKDDLEREASIKGNITDGGMRGMRKKSLSGYDLNSSPDTSNELNGHRVDFSGGRILKTSVKLENANSDLEVKKEFCPQFEFSYKFKYMLAHDQHRVTNMGMLTDLPTMPNVVSVLSQYVVYYATRCLKEYVNKNPESTCRDLSAKIQLCKEFVDNVRTCFDVLLDRTLLFDEERAQHELIKLTMDTRTTSCNFYNIDLLVPARPEPIENIWEEQEYCLIEDDASDEMKSESPNSKAEASLRYGLRVKKQSIYDTYRSTCFQSEVLDWYVVPDELIYEKPYLPAFIYGPIHLARFLVKFPKVVPTTITADPVIGPAVMEFFHTMLDFLCQHEDWFSIENYLPADVAETLPKLERDSENVFSAV